MCEPRAPSLLTIHSTRSFAMLHAAIFDAVNAIDRTYTPYAVKLPNVSRAASVQAAADEAAHDVLVSLYPTFSSSLDAELQQDLDEIPDSRHKAEGIAVGEAVATAILALRDDDGSGVTLPPFVPTNQPGELSADASELCASRFHSMVAGHSFCYSLCRRVSSRSTSRIDQRTVYPSHLTKSRAWV